MEPSGQPTYKTRMTRIAASSAWLSSYRMVRMLIAFAVGIIIARYLGPEDYGKLQYVLSVILIFMGIIGPGIKDVVTRRLDLNQAENAAIIRASFRLLLVSNSLMLAIALLLVSMLRPGEELILMMAVVFGVGNLFRAFEIYELWFHYRLEMGKTVLIQGTSFLLISSLKILLVLLGINVFWFAVVMGLELVITGIGFFLLTRWRQEGLLYENTKGTFAHAQSVLRESVPSVFGVAFILVLYKVDQVMLGWLKTDAEVGLYAVAVPFSEYWAFLAIAIVTSTYPALLEAYRQDSVRFENYFKQIAGFLTWLAVLIIIPVWLLGEFIILTFLGETFQPSARILSIHIWSLYFIFMIEVMKKWYVIHQRLSYFLMISGLAAAINIVVNLWLIPAYGGTGAAWATIIAYSCAGSWGLLLFRETRKPAVLIILSVTAPVNYLRTRIFKG